MGTVSYYILYGIVRVITLLPLNILYIFSYFLFFLLYTCPGYRRNITRENLTNAFPKKSAEEIKRIEKRFYRHLADLFIEAMKAVNISSDELIRRYKIVNSELPDRLFAEKRDIAAVIGHYNNWEWLSCLPLQITHTPLMIYKPLKNKRFDTLLLDTRSKHGAIITPMSKIVREIIAHRNKGINTMSVFIADQTPPKKDIKYRTDFLNQDTPVFLGAEKIAAKFNMALLFMHIRKVRRGYYEIEFEELFRETASLPDYTATEAHVRRLEENINKAPEYWIWTHRRWKHKRENHDD